MKYNNNLMEVQLISKIEPQNRIHLTSADIVDDVIGFGFVDYMK